MASVRAAPLPRDAAPLPGPAHSSVPLAPPPSRVPGPRIPLSSRRSVLLLTASVASLAPPLSGPGLAAEGPSVSPRVELSIAVDRKPFGRVVIELFRPETLAAQRFLGLVRGSGGVGLRASKFDQITDEYVLNGGVARLSYSADGACPLPGGDSVAALLPELATAVRHDAPGLVTLILRDDKPRPVESKVVAVNGKLTVVETQLGPEAPNGTGFAITLQAAPSLDGLALPVGRVVEGMDVIERMGRLPVVQDNSGSPFLQAGLAIGDKRAAVAQRGFRRPFARISVASCSVLA